MLPGWSPPSVVSVRACCIRGKMNDRACKSSFLSRRIRFWKDRHSFRLPGIMVVVVEIRCSCISIESITSTRPEYGRVCKKFCCRVDGRSNRPYANSPPPPCPCVCRRCRLISTRPFNDRSSAYLPTPVPPLMVQIWLIPDPSLFMAIRCSALNRSRCSRVLPTKSGVLCFPCRCCCCCCCCCCCRCFCA